MVKATAIVVTRGDVDLGPSLANLRGFDEIIIRRGQAGVWERYEAAYGARNNVIYTQDDDCVVDAAAVVDKYDHGAVVCNMPEWKRPEYEGREGIGLVGWGAVFHKSALATGFDAYLRKFEIDAIFRREADRVFTAMNESVWIDVPFEHLPWAKGNDRLGAAAEHGAALEEIRRRIRAVKHVG